MQQKFIDTGKTSVINKDIKKENNNNETKIKRNK